jgi:hypothetical protein
MRLRPVPPGATALSARRQRPSNSLVPNTNPNSRRRAGPEACGEATTMRMLSAAALELKLKDTVLRLPEIGLASRPLYPDSRRRV